MTALEVAQQMGLTIKQFEDYTNACRDIVEAPHHVAILKGNEVHLAVKVRGLAGRRVLRECGATLARWFDIEPVLMAPIRHGNARAIRMASALGFSRSHTTDTHLWMRQTKEHFHG
jgi:hypothetical protein